MQIYTFYFSYQIIALLSLSNGSYKKKRVNNPLGNSFIKLPRHMLISRLPLSG